MAFFKFRWPGSAEPQGDSSKPARRARGNAQAESIEEMRRRARHRLIGAAVLVLAGVVGFPLVFDTQPRPVAVNVAIDIPDRNKVAPLVLPQKGAAEPAPRQESPTAGLDEGEEVLSTRAGSEATPPSPPRLPAEPQVQIDAKPEPKPAAKPEPKPEAKPEHKPEPKTEPKTEAKPLRMEEAARARALLEGRGPQAQAAGPAAADQGRFIVQVGAFADADKVREVRQRLERSGLKTYTQLVDTKDGKRTRVRLGPFDSRAEADKAVGRVKGAGLSASVLAL
ncbi:SPOR domain-containing protein [Alicycliphilus denitrificans]|uniref:SPOR domain-containing protein n=1 Tax=Alicycliphilus denitrificans TaxID=179636 RepID=UPI00384C964F